MGRDWLISDSNYRAILFRVLDFAQEFLMSSWLVMQSAEKYGKAK